MDKFVIRTPREAHKPKPKKNRKFYIQSKIESMQGVVVIEDLERAEVLLKREDVSPGKKVKTLRFLLTKRPAKEVLMKTNIGKTVHKLCKHEDEVISSTATEVYKSWKENIMSKVNRPKIEVACDLKTQKFRASARKMIRDAMKRETDSSGVKPLVEETNNNKESGKRKRESEVDTEKQKKSLMESKSDSTEKIHKISKVNENNLDELAEYIERELFLKTKRLINYSYKRSVRKLVFSLKHQDELRLSIVNSTKSVDSLIEELFQS